MRKNQQKQVFDLLQTLEEAMIEIKKLVSKRNARAVLSLISDTNVFIGHIKSFIDDIAGKRTKTAALLDEMRTSFSTAINDNERNPIDLDFVKMLKKQLVKIQNSVYNELKPTKIEIAFFPYKASMADSLESIYIAAKKDPICDAYWIPVPYYLVNTDATLGNIQYDGHKYPEYLKSVDWKTYDVEAHRPDVIFIHYLYDANNLVTRIHPDFFAERLKDFTDMLVYIPYFICVNDVSEPYCVQPGTIYADKVIVQSEKIRQTYIRIFNAWIKKESGITKSHPLWPKFSNPSEKFVALGSPKLDVVINTKPEDFTLPEEWRKLIESSEKFQKKIVLYNTRYTDMTQGIENMIIKLRNVLEFFKNRNDTVLWWRPHPLNMSCLYSMRPHYYFEYKNIVDNYKIEKWGIYDDTEDLSRAIVLSDSLYSDVSSIVGMFAISGKPMMLQNIEFLDATEKHIGEIQYNNFLNRCEKWINQNVTKTQNSFLFNEEKIKSPYSFMLFENELKPLEFLIRFIDSVKNGDKRALLFREAQIAYTQRINANLEGTSGESIYNHIKSFLMEDIKL